MATRQSFGRVGRHTECAYYGQEPKLWRVPLRFGRVGRHTECAYYGQEPKLWRVPVRRL